ncbi:MAG: AAA family ATPase, partial [Muribaculaceae bacterium]|nr:AAA family ATPase [Muribaculaceae bacterium]
MDASLKYPVGIQTFEKIIKGGYTYVDKTEYIRKLLRGGEYYFLSRPRRFGKSMFLTTLEAYFEGRRDLFKGLALDSYDDLDWTPRPVIKMAFNALDPQNPEDLVRMVSNRLSFYEKRYGVEDIAYNLADRFINLIMRANEKTGRKVAVLIDEYDAPLLATLLKPELNEKYRDTIKSLLTVLKTADEYIGFAFVTGVSRFSHTSLFSGANNLSDISMDDRYAAICGITEEELTAGFMPGIRDFARKLRIS